MASFQLDFKEDEKSVFELVDWHKNSNEKKDIVTTKSYYNKENDFIMSLPDRKYWSDRKILDKATGEIKEYSGWATNPFVSNNRIAYGIFADIKYNLYGDIAMNFYNTLKRIVLSGEYNNYIDDRTNGKGPTFTVNANQNVTWNIDAAVKPSYDYTYNDYKNKTATSVTGGYKIDSIVESTGATSRITTDVKVSATTKAGQKISLVINQYVA